MRKDAEVTTRLEAERKYDKQTQQIKLTDRQTDIQKKERNLKEVEGSGKQ